MYSEFFKPETSSFLIGLVLLGCPFFFLELEESTLTSSSAFYGVDFLGLEGDFFCFLMFSSLGRLFSSLPPELLLTLIIYSFYSLFLLISCGVLIFLVFFCPLLPADLLDDESEMNFLST